MISDFDKSLESNFLTDPSAPTVAKTLASGLKLTSNTYTIIHQKHYLFIVSNKLLYYWPCTNVPNGAGCVDWTGTDNVQVLSVPIEACLRSASIFFVIGWLQWRCQFRRTIVLYSPDFKRLPSSYQQVWVGIVLIWNPHLLCARELVVECEVCFKGLWWLIKLNYTDFILVFLYERTTGNPLLERWLWRKWLCEDVERLSRFVGTFLFIRHSIS